MWTYVPAYKVWYTSPRPNFGLFIIKSHELNDRVLSRSWVKYDGVPLNRRMNVAVDQNIVGGNMGWARYRFGLCFYIYYTSVYIYSDMCVIDLTIIGVTSTLDII